ncbi:MAG: hypothetical protein Kow00114_26180 [Kiloniellaceae bacterium]
MTKSVVFTTIAAAALAFGLAACDEQQASETSSAPMQQQGAVPEAGSGTTAPMAPESGDPAAAPEGMQQPEGSEPDSTLPGSSQ